MQARVTLVVVNRPGVTSVHLDDAALSDWDASTIEVPALEISSSDLRERAATGRPLDYLIPERDPRDPRTGPVRCSQMTNPSKLPERCETPPLLDVGSGPA